MLQFVDISNTDNTDNTDNKGKVYLSVTNTIPPRKVFVRYDGDNRFTYFDLMGNDIAVTYPNDFHSPEETISFYEMPISDDIAKVIQRFGTQYGGKKQSKKQSKKNKKSKHHKRMKKTIKRIRNNI
jgi:hypothetical protein